MKGYWIARIDVTDEEVYPEYGKRAMPAIAKYGGRLIVRGGRATTREGRDYRHAGMTAPEPQRSPRQLSL